MRAFNTLLLTLVGLLVGWPVGAATFTVDSLADYADDNPGDGDCETLRGALGNFELVCTLRGAIQEANALAGRDTVEFLVAGTIRLGDSLPTVTERIDIRGDTAPGAPPATSDQPQPPVVVIEGNGSDALTLANTAALSTVFNLSIVQSRSAIVVEGLGVKLYGNWLGIDPQNEARANVLLPGLPQPAVARRALAVVT